MKTCCRMPEMWRRGWGVIGRTLLGSFILSLFQLPLILLGAIPFVGDFFRTDNAPSIFIRLALFALLILVYLPLSFYVAASAVGFCSPVANDA
jgi:hypothetical protein